MRDVGMWLAAAALVTVGSCRDGSPSADAGETGTTTSDTGTIETTAGETSGSSSSDETTGDPRCGNGVINADEQCDDGEDNGSYDKCNEDCSGEGPNCGDGNVDDRFEACDDGNAIGHDSCTNECTAQTCGDGVADPGDICYLELMELTLGNDPRDVAGADLDGDGNTDLTLADWGASEVVVLLGDGAGGFGPPATLAVPVPPAELVIADFDDDGSPDLVTVGDPNTDATVFLGAGDGSFGAAAHSFPVVNGAAAGPIDGDAYPDVIITTAVGFEVHLGVGDGTFVPHSSYPVAGFVGDSATIADLDGDDVADVVVGLDTQTMDDTAGIVQPYRGLGDGTLVELATYMFAEDADTIVVEDFDEDDVPDLAVLRNGPCTGGANLCVTSPAAAHPVFGEVTLERGLGAGEFELGTTHVVGISPRGIAALDVDNDGHIDLTMVYRNYLFGDVLRGDGAGDFERLIPFVVGSFNSGLATLDLNGDGVTDLAFGRRDTEEAPGGLRLLISDP